MNTRSEQEISYLQANPFTLMFSKKAMKMILETYKAIAKDGEEARKPRIGQVLLASTYAGILECKPEEVYDETGKINGE